MRQFKDDLGVREKRRQQYSDKKRAAPRFFRGLWVKLSPSNALHLHRAFDYPPLACTAVSFLLAICISISAAHAADCPAPTLVPIHFAPGEKLKFRLDVFGADMGTLEVWLDAPNHDERSRGTALVAHGRAKTSAFVATNVGPYLAHATTRIGPAPKLLPLWNREEVDDSGTHWLHEFSLPPAQGQIKITSSKNGEPLPLSLAAGPNARDLLSELYALRASPLATGTPLCFEVYAGRKMWRMTGAVGPRETVETPMGKIKAMRIDLTSTLVENPKFSRMVKFWISDDERRLPLAAIAEIRGKVVRAQLVSTK
jgi:hypothetical protein